jgi:cell division protein FtsB
MTKSKKNHRSRNEEFLSQPHSFFYRLISSQRFLAIIGLVFLVIVIFPLARAYNQRRLVEREITDVKKQISDFENQNQELKELVEYLQSDQALEEQARLNLNLKKPGEEVIVIENKGAGVATVDSSVDESIGNLIKWWRYFFN